MEVGRWGGRGLEGFVLPKPGVFPPPPRPKVGAARAEKDARVDAGVRGVGSKGGEDGRGVGHGHWGGE